MSEQMRLTPSTRVRQWTPQLAALLLAALRLGLHVESPQLKLREVPRG
jgi:hypothetical protein